VLQEAVDCNEVELSIEGGDVLTAEGFERGLTVRLGGGRILALADARPGAQTFDARGLLVLPGMVDIHGDAFERQLMPRPGVNFPHTLALIESDRQLAANGVTTAFHGLTWSWEPGLRGAEAARAFFEALDAARPQLACDTRLHLRFETHNTGQADAVVAALTSGRVDLLAFNDHIGHLNREMDKPHKVDALVARTGLTREEYRARLDQAASRAAEVPGVLARLSRTAGGRLPMASHDDDTAEIRARYRDLGCLICEFPTSYEAARAAREHGDHVVCGAPNVLRGRSHTVSGVLASRAVAEGLCDVLASDYYYPSLLEAPFALDRQGVAPLEKAWRLVSENPARAALLHDRGRVEPGLLADLILVDPHGVRPEAVAVFRRGRLIHARPQAFARLRCTSVAL